MKNQGNPAIHSAAALALTAALCAVPALHAQAITGPFTTFPSEAIDDGRMLSLVNGLAGLSGNKATLGLSVPAAETSFGLRIFDGDTSEPCAIVDPTCQFPGLGHWDEGSTEMIVRMYFDADRDGVVAPADPGDTLVGEWRGNATNPTSDVSGRWLADAVMPDNDWWNLVVNVLPGDPASPSGTRFYFVEMELDPFADDGVTVSNFKVSSNVPLSIFSASFGFEASAGGGPNDLNILYPDFDIFISPLDFFVTDPPPRSTYDGSFSFFLDVPVPIENFRVWDGDFDFGTNLTAGFPSGFLFDPCAEDDDVDSPPLPPFAGPNARVQTAQPPGSPADDNRFDPFRRSPCIVYTVTDPNGVVYSNANPSGDREWEQFLITSDPSATTAADADYSPSYAADGTTLVTTDMLPAGLWTISVDGLDLGNSNFWRFELTACGLIDGAPACPPEPYLIGDRVWLDEDGDGVQDAGEPGVAGVKVNASDSDGTIISEEATEPTDGRYFQDVLPGTYSVELGEENFTFVFDGALGDLVWLDADGDGFRDPGEPGLRNVRVELIDEGTGAAIRATVTSTQGEYLFDDLPPGTYRTRVDETTLPAGLSQTFGTNPSAMRTITSNETFLDLDFGYAPPVASLGDFVWYDMDGDGRQDQSEAGIRGVRLDLYEVSGSPVFVATTKTRGGGVYLFTGLAAGTYEVRVVASNFLPGEPLEGYTVTFGPESEGADVSAARILVGTETVLDVDFGYDRGDLRSITDRVWFDLDADGLFEPAEGDFPLVGVCASLVTRGLINGVGDLIVTSVSDTGGLVSFSGLPGGGKQYTIRIRDCSGAIDDLVGTSEPALDRRIDVLVNGTDVFGENFGYVNQARFDGWTITTPSTQTNTVFDANVLTYDFGIQPPECSECDGKVTTLTLQYLGPEAAQVRVETRKGAVLFDAPVQPGRALTVIGNDKHGTLGPEIEVYLDGVLHTRIHTSCSQPIGPGLQFGYFLVTRGASRHGGELCPLEGDGDLGFECRKPMDAITMIWQGAGTIDVQPWKSDVGDTMLPRVDGLAPGDEITVSGLTGSRMNVRWELFDNASGAKLGESEFHLSCSDANMNGPEDCGKPQGNGSGDNSLLINDWIFEGLVGTQGFIDCTY